MGFVGMYCLYADKDDIDYDDEENDDDDKLIFPTEL